MATEPRWWFSRPGETLLSRCRPIQRGSDEFARATVALRVPGGFLVVPLWRMPEFRGPCARCGQWEHEDAWEAPHCQSCAGELADQEAGCICPSWMDDDYLDQPWPTPGCAVHDQRMAR